MKLSLLSSIHTAALFSLLAANTSIAFQNSFHTTEFIKHNNKHVAFKTSFLHPNHSQNMNDKQLRTPVSLSMMDGFNEFSSFAENTGMMLSEDSGLMTDTMKTVVITLFFGGGLIPASIAANKAMFATLSGAKKDIEVSANPETSLDPTAAIPKTYISSSGATGPKLSNAQLIFASEEIPLVDMIAICGRISDINSVAKWGDLPSTKLPNLSNKDKPPMWLPRATFKSNVRAAKFQSWPVDPDTGLPIGGEDLKKAEEGRIKKNGALIGDAALDAVFDTWAWGAGIATPDKVEAQLNDWKVGNTLNVGKLTFAAIRGRATTGIAALTFIIIQVVAYGSLFIAPALRVFFDIDIGFGITGSCSDNGCTSLF